MNLSNSLSFFQRHYIFLLLFSIHIVASWVVHIDSPNDDVTNKIAKKNGFTNVGKNFTVICEGEKGWVQCKEYELIKITRSFWGRGDHATCPKVPAGLTSDRVCETNSENTVAKVNGQCKNEQACEVVASNIFFDDNSCGNVYKYLIIWYECIPDESNVVDVLREGGRKKKKRNTKEKRSFRDS